MRASLCNNLYLRPSTSFFFFANVDMQLTDSNYYPVLIKQISQFGSFLIDKEANLDRNLRFKEADVRNDVP